LRDELQEGRAAGADASRLSADKAVKIGVCHPFFR